MKSKSRGATTALSRQARQYRHDGQDCYKAERPIEAMWSDQRQKGQHHKAVKVGCEGRLLLLSLLLKQRRRCCQGTMTTSYGDVAQWQW
jgi:hypothetical protein